MDCFYFDCDGGKRLLVAGVLHNCCDVDFEGKAMTNTVDQMPEYPQTLSLADVDHANIQKPNTWTIEHFECWQREQVARENVRVLRRHIKKLRQAIEQAEKQKPVAYVNDDGFIIEKDLDIAPGEKLYLAPPKREWIGLTENEVDRLSREMVKVDKSVNWLTRAIEAKLKEKNT